MTLATARQRVSASLGLAGLVLASAAVFWPIPADAATINAAGWWDRNQGLSLTAPAPPPEGALRVGNDPGGASALAALRYTLETNESLPTLELRVTGSPAGDAAGFAACPTTSEWEPSAGGPFADAPDIDCDRSVGGVVSSDGTVVSFPLSTLVSNSVLDIAIVAAPTAGDPVGDSFSVDFAAPTSADLKTVVQNSPGPAPVATAPPTTASGNTAPPAAPPTTSARPVAAPVTAAPATTVFVSPTIGAPVPTAAPVPAAGPPPLSDEVAGAVPISAPEGRNRVGALAVAAALVAGAVWFQSQDKTEDTGDAPLGGLGKFVKARPEPVADIS